MSARTLAPAAVNPGSNRSRSPLHRLRRALHHFDLRNFAPWGKVHAITHRQPRPSAYEVTLRKAHLRLSIGHELRRVRFVKLEPEFLVAPQSRKHIALVQRRTRWRAGFLRRACWLAVHRNALAHLRYGLTALSLPRRIAPQMSG